MQAVLAEIVSDFSALRRAYDAAGLLGEVRPGSMAWALLGDGEGAYRFRRDVLLLDALVRNRVARAVLDGGPIRHAVAFGGNNVGKSTIVNILAAAAVAVASPEGGHTNRPRVIANATAGLFGRNPHAFRGFEAARAGHCPPDDLSCYEVSETTVWAMSATVALWDTPDCDSVGSARYLASVVEAVAAADVLIYVTSVEKYAVEALVEWVFQIADAGTPIVECINKTPRRDRDAVIARQNRDIFPAVSERLGMDSPAPSIVALRNMTEGEESDLWGPDHAEAAQLRAEVSRALETASRAEAGRRALDYVARNLEKALGPVRMEVDARRLWAAAVDSAMADFVASYERDYLTSDTVVEPISRLNVQVLDLLNPDIPGLKQAIQWIRWITRWPSKLILAVGRGLYSVAFSSGSPESAEIAPELKAYSEAHTHILNALGRRIEVERGAARHHPFWDALAEAWQAELKLLAERFGVEVEAHMRQTDAEIRAAAQDILAQLRQSPATLNFLRGLRVSVDVGGAVAGFLLPGKGSVVYDLLEEAVLTPTIIGAAEAAATAMAQGFVKARRDKVIDDLLAEARLVAERVYRGPLLAISEAPAVSGCAIGVGQDLIDRLSANIARLREDMADLPA